MKVLLRSIELERGALDVGTRTVPCTLSSETPVDREFGPEVLVHTPEAIDLTRAANGLPLLFSHQRDQPIGRVEAIRLENRRLRGVLRFSENAKAREVFADVQAGILTDLSVGYRVAQMDPPAGPDAPWLVSKWEPLESSIVTIPADPTVGIGRQAAPFNYLENPSMPVHTEIREAVRAARLDDALADDLIARGITADAARREVLNMLAERSDAAGITSRIQPERESTDDPMVRARLMSEVLAARCGGPAPSEPAREFSNLRVADMARDLLEARGTRTNRLTSGEIVTRALHTTSDFANLLTATGDRVLRNAYASYPGGVKRIARQSTTRDFRAKSLLQLGEAPTLEKVNEHGEFKYGSMGESASSYSLATYGKIFGISRQALVNDDLDAFGSMAQRFGRAAAEFEAGQLAALLSGNPTLADGVALFHANHGNKAASGGAISITTLGTARKAMRLQKGLDGVTPIDVTPAFLVVPAALETVAEQYLAQLSPAVSSDSNPFSGRLELVVDPRLDAVSATAWYLAADPAAFDTLEYSYLEGQPGPVIETRQGFEVDGVEMKVRLDFGAGVVDFRGLFMNAGA